jgi:endogenous inhibitor of DNA gyrase (YacG/DUF329 family)
MMDFGAWANEEYRIANATPPDGESTLDLLGESGAQ